MTAKSIVDAQELASILGVHVQSVRNWVNSGIIPPSTYIKGERTYRFVVDDVIDALRASSMPEPANPNQLELPLGVAEPDEPTTAHVKQPIAIYEEEDDER